MSGFLSATGPAPDIQDVIEDWTPQQRKDTIDLWARIVVATARVPTTHVMFRLGTVVRLSDPMGEFRGYNSRARPPRALIVEDGIGLVHDCKLTWKNQKRIPDLLGRRVRQAYAVMVADRTDMAPERVEMDGLWVSRPAGSETHAAGVYSVLAADVYGVHNAAEATDPNANRTWDSKYPKVYAVLTANGEEDNPMGMIWFSEPHEEGELWCSAHVSL